MANDVLKVEFPQGRIYVTNGGKGKAYIEYNKSYVNKFNNDLNKLQLYHDNKVGTYLQDYVSYKTGTQAKSIPIAGTYGKGYVIINVPYAEYQAYSKRIKKRVGKRGTHPFERMKADKKDTILKQDEAYSRRLNG